VTRPLPTGIRPLLAANFIATVAVVGQATALGKLVFDLTGRELDLGLLGLAEFLPVFLLAPVAGPIADRHDRRKVAVAGVGLEAVASAGLSWFAFTGQTSLLWVYMLVLVVGVARAFIAPATRALPADLVRGDQLGRVVALSAGSWQAGLVVGPVLGGFLYAARAGWPFAAAALLIAMTAILLLRIPPVPPHSVERGSPLTEALAGLRFIRRTPLVLGAVSLDLFAVLFGGAVALLPAIAEKQLGVGAVGLGWLRAAVGIGAGLMTATLAWRPVGRRVGRVLLAAVAAFGLGTIVLGLTKSYPVAFAALLILSAADAVSVWVRATLVPLATPAAMRGRVLAMENVFIGASNELGAFESGVAAALVGLVGAVVLGGAATIGIVFVWWLLFPTLRDVDRFADVRVG
jgi:MFS family permease